MNRTLWEELVAYAMPPNKLVSGLASMWYVKRLLDEILGLRREVCSTWATSTWLENAICFFDRNLCKFFDGCSIWRDFYENWPTFSKENTVYICIWIKFNRDGNSSWLYSRDEEFFPSGGSYWGCSY